VIKNVEYPAVVNFYRDRWNSIEKMCNNDLMSHNTNCTLSKRWTGIRIVLLITAIVFGIYTICFGVEKGDKESLSQFIEGTYSVIGKRPGTNETYYGAMKITASNNRLAIVRCVKGKRVTGSAEIVEVTADKIPNLRYSYKDGKSIYEGRYDIHSDVDNYGRLSGPYTKKGSKGKLGWEMLYIDSNTPNECN
jgi:hypothetical protein